MVVGRIGNRKILGLAEDVISLDGKSELILEQEFGDFRIDA